jgi:predicted ATPase
MVLILAAWLHAHRQEWPEAQAEAEVLLALAEEQGFALRVTEGTLLRGGALVGQGKVEEGIVQIRQGLTAYQAMGAGVAVTYFLALLAAAYGKVGQAKEGLALIAEALAVVEKTGGRHWEAELYRIKGELRLQSKVLGPKSKAEEEAEECFHKAIEIARKQQAKSWELRASTSLARLWQQQGKASEAHQMLSEIYHWFTEGFDTKDLQEAKALIEELRH